MSARRVTRLSFTKLSLFEFCPTAYRYRYVERVPIPFAPRLVVGAIVHAVLNRLFERVQARERVDKAVLDRLHADYWAQAPRLDPERFPDMWHDGQALLDGYWSANHQNLGHPVLLESRFRFRPDPQAGYSIEGVIDRVDETRQARRSSTTRAAGVPRSCQIAFARSSIPTRWAWRGCTNSRLSAWTPTSWPTTPPSR